MTELDDHELLAAYARDASEAAFATLVARHLSLVHSTALRSTGNPHHAQEIAQAVFLILARKAGGLGRGVVLSGWLYQTARLTAANFVKREIHRQEREQEAYMQSTLNEPAAAWEQVAPLLDEAMGRLGETDRNAVVLRYFENKSAREVAATLKLNEAAAHKRLSRALEKLRKFFTRRGVTLSAAAIAGAVSANSVQAAPAGLAQTISAVALTKGVAAGGPTLALVKGALKLMAWTKAKLAAGVVVGVLLAAGTTTVVVEEMARSQGPAWANDAGNWKPDSRTLDKLPPAFILRPTRFPRSGGTVMSTAYPNNHTRILSLNLSLAQLVTSAFAYDQTRCVFPDPLPVERYDLLFTLPEDYHPALQAELHSRFGLSAQVEKRTVEVWLLQVRTPNAPGLEKSTGDENSWRSSPYETHLRGQRVADTLVWLENALGRPIIDQTGLIGRYDMDLNWQPGPGQSEAEALRQALPDQLGLELVPDRQPVDMLVVDKVK